MNGRTIAVGDIHGCNQALRALVAKIALRPCDTLVALGDYIDRGPDSHDVIEQLLTLSKHCHVIPLLGNHESMLLLAREHPTEQVWWESIGGSATLLSYRDNLLRAGHDLAFPNATESERHASEEQTEGKSNDGSVLAMPQARMRWIPNTHLDFFRSCSLAYETDTHIFVHASYEAHLPMAEQREDVLLWRHLTPADLPGPHLSGKTVVVGHSPQVGGEILDLGYLKCIDTYCFGDGYLTALDVDSGQIWQTDRSGTLVSSD